MYNKLHVQKCLECFSAHLRPAGRGSRAQRAMDEIYSQMSSNLPQDARLHKDFNPD